MSLSQDVNVAKSQLPKCSKNNLFIITNFIFRSLLCVKLQSFVSLFSYSIHEHVLVVLYVTTCENLHNILCLNILRTVQNTYCIFCRVTMWFTLNHLLIHFLLHQLHVAVNILHVWTFLEIVITRRFSAHYRQTYCDTD